MADETVTLVTGASRGIGAGIARRIASDGGTVVAVARSADLLDALASTFPSGRVIPMAVDLRAPEAPGWVVQETLARIGRLDRIVANAGATKRADFLTLTDADWEDGFALKFFAHVRLLRAAWPSLVTGGGRVVVIAGVGGRTGTAEFTIGGSVNAALMNLTKCLADRGVGEGVRVNALNPGSIRTDRLKGRIAAVAQAEGVGSQAAEALMLKATGVARFGEPEDIAAAVTFLLGDGAGYIQGAVLDVDGGLTRTL